ncbi:MAG: hypothetical protein E7329_03885, partial [Clostridiales bacterium]|nr:hypothetical protein [Clostridiales bacterium]
MKHFPTPRFSQKLLALLLVCTLLLPLCANAGSMSQAPFIINIQWTGADGVPQSAGATQVFYPGFEDCYWVYLPTDAPMEALTVHISDPTNTYTSFSIPSGTLLPPMADAGMSLNSVNPVDIMGFTADGQPGALLYLYVSTLSPLPDDPAIQAQMASVTIRYLAMDGAQVASPEVKEYAPGSHEIFAQPYDLQPGYRLSGADSQWINVESGAMEVVFYYEAATATLQISLTDQQSGQILGTFPVQVKLGQVNSIALDASWIPADYALVGQPSLDVYVNDQGIPDTQPVFHLYSTLPTPAPTPLPTEVPTPEPTPDPTPAPTEVPVQPAQITLRYQTQEGAQVASPHEAVVNPGYNEVYPTPHDLQPGYQLAAGFPAYQIVTVDAFGPSVTEVIFYYEAVTGTVSVSLVDQQTGQILDSFPVQVKLAQVNSIALDTSRIPANYALAGQPYLDVYVNEQGIPDTQPIFYLYSTLPTPAPTQEPTAVPTQAPTLAPTEIPTQAPTEVPVLPPVPLNVVYLNIGSGMPVATGTVIYCEVGKSTLVRPAPADLLPDYVLVSSDAIEVSVDVNGVPNMPEVAFLYQYQPQATVPSAQEPTQLPTLAPTQAPTAVPAPKIALVGVKYIDPTGAAFYNYTETCAEGAGNVIRVDWSLVPVGYELASAESMQVTVDAYGVAQPAEVVFQFKDEVNAYVTIYFRTLSGVNVASPVQELCLVGNNSFEARPLDLQPNYQLIGPAVQNVMLGSDGVLSPNELVFLYEYLPTPSPVPSTATPFPYQYTPMDSYCYPQNDGINFRSGPTTEENNIISTVSRSNLAHIIGRVINSKNEIWYLWILA